ncbi:unnamed protein product [Paramecium pentaurelia]|uniref:Peptidase C1A papain C-terminal domain-containing protein n=1 Tax=Paramecium pentaurelia TaxID=43138 RepID=A0A8S1UHU5_9CILI|nr:unnamed protein product [Paramecium pentaurelia]
MFLIVFGQFIIRKVNRNGVPVFQEYWVRITIETLTMPFLKASLMMLRIRTISLLLYNEVIKNFSKPWVPNSKNINLDDKNFKYTEGAVDWTNGLKIMYFDVKHQEKCGSCGRSPQLEQLKRILNQYTTLHTLSEQEPVHCSRQYGNLKCDDGWMMLLLNMFQ